MTSFADRRTPSIRGFVVERLQGEGNFGVVWLARRENSDSLVAIKLPKADRLLEYPVLRDAFEQEIDAALRAPRHPNVLLALEATEAVLADGVVVPGLVMEYVAGATGLLEDAEVRTLSRESRLALFLAAARGVAELQNHGCIHTDLKPQNILVGRDHVPRVADFGGLRILAEHKTGPAQISIRYAAPEVFSDQPEILDHRSVVYSLGKILAELLAGRAVLDLPGYRSREEAAALVRTWRPDRCREALGDGWEGVVREIERATQPAPSDRHPNAEAFLDALVHASAARPARIRRKLGLLWDEVPRSIRTTAMAAVLAVLCVVGAVGGGQVLAYHGQLGPGRYPKLVLTPVAAEHARRVVIVSVGTEQEVLDYATARGLEGVTDNRATWRAVWADLAEALGRCQPRALVFDIVFRRNDQHAGPHTQALADALRRLRDLHGVACVLTILPTWDPAPDDGLLDSRLAAAIAPQMAGAAEFDRGQCGENFAINLALLPTDLVQMAPSLALASVAAYFSERPSTPDAAPRGCHITVDVHGGVIEVRGPRRGGRIRTDQCELLSTLDRHRPSGVDQQAKSLPAGWSRDQVRAATRIFKWPNIDGLRARTYSLREILEIAEREPSQLRERVILLSNNAPSHLGATDMADCGNLSFPNAYFHAEAIETLLEEALTAGVGPREIGDTSRALLLAAVAAGGLGLGGPLARVGGRGARRCTPARLLSAWSTWSPRRRAGMAVLLLGILAIVLLVLAAWCRLVLPLLRAELLMTAFLALSAGLLWRVWSTRPAGPRDPAPPLGSPWTTINLSLAAPAALFGAPGLVLSAALSLGGGDSAWAASPPLPQPMVDLAGTPRTSGPPQGWSSAGGRGLASADGEIVAELQQLAGSFPNRRVVRQWYEPSPGSNKTMRRQTNYALREGKAQVDSSTGLVELEAEVPGGPTSAYFTTSLAPVVFSSPPSGTKLIPPISQPQKDHALSWWFPWVGQGPVQGASEGTQVAVVSRPGTPLPEDPPGATVELIRYYLVGPNAGSRVQLFNVAVQPPVPLLAVEGMAGKGFVDLAVDLRVVRSGQPQANAPPSVTVVAQPRPVTKEGTPDEFKELTALKQFAVTNGLRVPEGD